MLSPYRVLDLTDHRGQLAGMVLADLGADVIRVEPPGGSDARRRGPFLQAAPESERSLPFAAYDRGKRSLVLDLEDERGVFLELAAGADFVIESAPPSPLDAAGLGFERLRKANPRIVLVRITPYGEDGPHADLPATDLTVAAMGGPVSLQGVAERAPVRISVPQVWRHAGAEAAVAALVAHARMQRTGRAQCVDVSAQCAMTWTMLGGMNAAAIQGRDFQRSGSMLQLGPVTLPVIFPCCDGFVAALASGAQMGKFIGWLIDEGAADPAYADEEWGTYAQRLVAGDPVKFQPQEVMGALVGFLAARGKQEGVYPCAGEDQWCAISVESDAQWQALRATLGDPEWARAAELSTLDGRQRAHDAIDAGLSQLTQSRTPHEVMETLCAAGVPAGAVQRSSDLPDDPQLRHRGFHHLLDHPEMGRVPYAGHAFRVRGYASGPRSPAPVLGEHAVRVMSEILGMSDDEIAEVVAAGALC